MVALVAETAASVAQSVVDIGLDIEMRVQSRSTRPCLGRNGSTGT
jgi:hypothetical protein